MCIIRNHEKNYLTNSGFFGGKFSYSGAYIQLGANLCVKNSNYILGAKFFWVCNFFNWGKFEMFIFRASFIFERLVWSILCLGNLKSLFGVKFICLRASLEYKGEFF